MTTWENASTYIRENEITTHVVAEHKAFDRVTLIEISTGVVAARSSGVALKVLQKVNGDVSAIKGAV